MMEDKGVRRYVRAVSRRLICSKATRSRLLDGLQQELSAYSTLPYDDLCAQVGSPEQIAAQIMDNISEVEVSNTKRKRRLIVVLIICIFAVTAGVFGGYYIQANQVMRNDFYVEEENTTDEQVKKDITFEEALQGE